MSQESVGVPVEFSAAVSEGYSRTNWVGLSNQVIFGPKPTELAANTLQEDLSVTAGTRRQGSTKLLWGVSCTQA